MNDAIEAREANPGTQAGAEFMHVFESVRHAVKREFCAHWLALRLSLGDD